MNRTLLVSALLAGVALTTSFAASAQATAAGSVQRDVNQENRIESGLQNGRITTRENAELQRDEAHVDKLQARDMKDGTLTGAEKARLNAAQNKTSRDIDTAEHNGVNGNPLSASSQRAQAETQRNINQQQRIENGVKGGGLTNRETAKLENGESKIDKREYRAGANGRIGAGENAKVARADNRESGRIYNKRHNANRRAHAG
jgi:hypothetical protein